ncbi:hypothetical protein QBC39DRAFT_329807 [Podospora conica]|nr:hypothetical protein QBC39DRAFT_329807 [Schizothecium conicum]
MAPEDQPQRRLKKRPSLQNCLEWLSRRRSFASLMGETTLAASQGRATTPIPEGDVPTEEDTSSNSARPVCGTTPRAATPPPKLDVPISTSPIDWWSPTIPPSKPAAAPTTPPPPKPAAHRRATFVQYMTEEGLAEFRRQARQNINERAAAAIAAAAAAVALPGPDYTPVPDSPIGPSSPTDPDAAAAATTSIAAAASGSAVPAPAAAPAASGIAGPGPVTTPDNGR